MSTEIILLARQVARELKSAREVKPGLRKRLNELRGSLLVWLSSETRRGHPEPERKQGPPKRQRIAQPNGKYKYQMVQTLVETGELVPGRLVRSELYEAIETLLVVVAGGCAAKPKPDWSIEACADGMLRSCEYLESLLKESPNESQQDLLDSVLRDFLLIWKSRESYADAGNRMAEKLSDQDFEKYKQAKPGRRIKNSKLEHFTRLAKNWEQTGVPENLK